MSEAAFTQSVTQRKVYLDGKRLGGVTLVRVQAKRDYSLLPDYRASTSRPVRGHTRYLIRIVRKAPLNQPVNWVRGSTQAVRIAGDGEDWLYYADWISLTEQVDKNGNVESVVDLVAAVRTVYVEGA